MKLLAFTLVLLVALCSGIALAQGGDSQSATPDEATLSAPPSEPEGQELEGKRTASSQTFLLPGGARETRIFEAPINYRAPDEQWKPIEEGLKPSDGAALTNGNNRFETRLPAKLGAGAVRLEAGDQWIAERLLGAETGSVQLSDEETATYESPGGGTRFQFSTLGNGLKEEIELADPSQPNAFGFELTASQGITPSHGEDGTIEFRGEDGELVATLPAPVVSDSAGLAPVSAPIRYALEPIGAARWQLTIQIDRGWLARPDRSWPVHVDPTLELKSPSLDCTYGGTTGSNGWGLCGSSGQKTLIAAYRPGKTDEWTRSLLRFNLTSIPSTAYIASATVGLHAPAASSSTTGVELRRVTQSWNSSVNWKYYGDASGNAKWTSEGGDFTSEGSEILTSQRGSQAGWWTFSEGLVPVVQQWVTPGSGGPTPNYGFVAKLRDDHVRECDSSGACTVRSLEFDSSAAAESSLRPQMTVIYYPSASSDSKVSLPLAGTRSAKRFKLKAAWNHAGVTGAYFQYKSTGGWTDVPAAKVTDKNNKAVSWPLAIEGAHESQPVYWNATSAMAGVPVQKLQIRAILVSESAGGYTQPVSVEFNSETGGTKDATAAVGPGTVNLLTGNLTVSRTDVSIPGFGSALEFSRTYSSREAPLASGEQPPTSNTTVLGKRWSPGAPVEAAGGTSWRSIKELGSSEEGEYAILTDLQGNEYAFEWNGSSYLSPPEAVGWLLFREGADLVLANPGGNRVTFTKGSGATEYLPASVSQPGGAGNKTRMIYKLVGTSRRLSMIIAPSAAGVSCESETEATANPGCRALSFAYQPATIWGAPASYGERLSSITYYGPASATSTGHWEVANYAYNNAGQLTQEWDPRISPNKESFSNLPESYSYESTGRIQTITPPGLKSWTLEYGTFEEQQQDGRLIAVKRPSLLESPSTAQTTIVYGVPVTGSGAPYDLSGPEVAKWGQLDVPTDATAIFPPDQVPATPPSSYSRAAIYYLDSEGMRVISQRLLAQGRQGPRSPPLKPTNTGTSLGN
jgi:Domain of unknown function (DUF6531)